MSKKSQLQTFETIVVLFIFFILIGIGMIFYVRVYKSNIEMTKHEYSQSKSVAIAQRSMFMQELQCNDDKDNCIDLMKMEAAKSIMGANKIYYYDLFEFAEINITRVYPNPTIVPTTIYSRRINKPSSSFLTYVPVSLYNPIDKTYEFGIMSIQTQSK